MKNIVCVFAHPDDEAMGPGGTIARLSKDNNVYILCATSGQAGGGGKNSKESLSSIRKKELLKSAKILGVKKVYFLGFIDGELCNAIYKDIVDKVKKYLDEIKPEVLLTFELRGISGHIDHIVMASISSYLYDRSPYIRKLMYHCLDEARANIVDDYFVYFPPGYKKSEIGESVDVSGVWDKKIAAIKCHSSQIDDVNFILDYLKKFPKEEHFLIRVK
jgi:LmbE family N-acetylglucosaminyl deacetylase